MVTTASETRKLSAEIGRLTWQQAPEAMIKDAQRRLKVANAETYIRKMLASGYGDPITTEDRARLAALFDTP